jgi:hypothetical protein
MSLRFEPPTIKERGELARLMDAVQRHKPEHGEASGTLRCACGGTLKFNIQSNGISRGTCLAGCWRRWQQ